MGSRLITVVETRLFMRQAAALWDDATRHGFIDHIARHPRSGDVIQGLSGVRKVRWGGQGRGKRGGVRVIYLHLGDDAPIYLLMAYGKNERTDLSASDRATVRELVVELKRALEQKGR